MNYWQPSEDPPINPEWVCNTCCRFTGMERGRLPGEYRCENCGTVYAVYCDGKTLWNPENQMFDSNAVRKYWKMSGKHIGQWTAEDWKAIGAPRNSGGLRRRKT